MANVKKVLETEVNGLKVKLLEYDVESEESVQKFIIPQNMILHIMAHKIWIRSLW